MLLITGWDVRIDPNERKIMGIVDTEKKLFTKEKPAKVIWELPEPVNPPGLQETGKPKFGLETATELGHG